MNAVIWSKSHRPVLSHRDVTQSIRAMRKRGMVGSQRPKNDDGMITILSQPQASIICWIEEDGAMLLEISPVNRNKEIPIEITEDIAFQFAEQLRNHESWAVTMRGNATLFSARI